MRQIIFCVCIFINIISNAQNVITMKYTNGIFQVPCVVNGIPLSFIFDTGASQVTLSITEAINMLKSGHLSRYNIWGASYSQIANGDITENTEIILDSIRIGDHVIYNIKASIVHNSKAPLLLGQSAIQKLGKIEMNGNKIKILPLQTTPLNPALIKLFLDTNAIGNGFNHPDEDKITSLSELCDEWYPYEKEKGYIQKCFYFNDINYDGIQELIVSIESGGTNEAIYEWLFSKCGSNKYCLVFTTMHSGTIFYDETIDIIESFRKSYFYTCGVCNIDDELPYFVPWVTRYYYKQGKVTECNEITSFQHSIIENLKFLFNRGIPELKGDLGHDDGTRQAYMEHIVKYYLYNGKNTEEVKSLFYRYYPGSDVNNIWQKISEYF